MASTCLLPRRLDDSPGLPRAAFPVDRPGRSSLAQIHLSRDPLDDENATDAAVVVVVIIVVVVVDGTLGGDRPRRNDEIIASTVVDKAVIGMGNGVVSFLLGATNNDSGG